MHFGHISISISVFSEANSEYKLKYYLSQHVHKRKISRSISDDAIKTCLLYGDTSVVW